VTLRANGRSCDSAYLILPELTMYQDVLEIISADRLRETLGLHDGDPVEVEMDLN
jgi:CTP-dependent riboflavin kinase